LAVTLCGDPVTDNVAVAWLVAALLLLLAPPSATGEPKLTPSTTNCTEPVGWAVEPAETSVTVAVKVTGVPKTAGLEDELTVVAVVAWLTTKLAVLLVVPVPPSVEVIAPVVLSLVPAVAPCTLTDTVQLAMVASVPPDKLTELEPPTAVTVPLQVLVTFGVEATTRPAGKLSVTAMPLSATLAFGFVMLKVKVLVPFSGIVVGLNALVIVGALATVRFAVAVLPVPPLVEVTAPVVFVY
jgi:hypothetical protein